MIASWVVLAAVDFSSSSSWEWFPVTWKAFNSNLCMSPSVALSLFLRIVFKSSPLGPRGTSHEPPAKSLCYYAPRKSRIHRIFDQDSLSPSESVQNESFSTLHSFRNTYWRHKKVKMTTTPPTSSSGATGAPSYPIPVTTDVASIFGTSSNDIKDLAGGSCEVPRGSRGDDLKTIRKNKDRATEGLTHKFELNAFQVTGNHPQ